MRSARGRRRLPKLQDSLTACRTPYSFPLLTLPLPYSPFATTQRAASRALADRLGSPVGYISSHPLFTSLLRHQPPVVACALPPALPSCVTTLVGWLLISPVGCSRGDMYPLLPLTARMLLILLQRARAILHRGLTLVPTLLFVLRSPKPSVAPLCQLQF